MKLQLIPAPQGAQWVRQAFVLFFKQPLGFAGLFATFMVALLVFSMLPMLGSILLLAAMPLVSLGFMIATRKALDGQFPTPKVYIEPLRASKSRRVALIQLGLLYALSTALILWLSAVIDGGALDRLMRALSSTTAAGDTAAQAQKIAELIADPRLQLGLFMRLGLSALLSVPFWHAPALVHWGDQGAGKALFFSLMACWKNKGAFTVYGLAWAGVVLVFALLANVVMALLGQASLVALAAMPASLIFSTVFYVSLYFTFADCFDTRPSDPALPNPP
jgi:hypothetical protein